MAKKEGIRKLFDNIAPEYDKLNHLLSLNIDKGWRRKAVHRGRCFSMKILNTTYEKDEG